MARLTPHAVKGITTSMRGQIDYCFIFREKSPDNLRKIYDTFAGGYFPNRVVFEQVFRSCTMDKRCLVVKNSDIKDESGSFDGGIYFYRAKVDHREFTIGCDAMWKHHYTTYNDHYESDEEKENAKIVTASGGGVLRAIADDREEPKRRREIEVALRKVRPGRARVVTQKG